MSSSVLSSKRSSCRSSQRNYSVTSTTTEKSIITRSSSRLAKQKNTLKKGSWAETVLSSLRKKRRVEDIDTSSSSSRPLKKARCYKKQQKNKAMSVDSLSGRKDSVCTKRKTQVPSSATRVQDDCVLSMESTSKPPVVTPSPFLHRQASYFSPTFSAVTLDITTSSSSNGASSSSSSSDDGSFVPPGVVDIDSLPECSAYARENIEFHHHYLHLYGKEYYTALFNKEELPSDGKRRTRTRIKHESGYTPCDYINRQAFISANMRAILVDWLIDVQEDLLLHESTLHSAVRILDRALSCVEEFSVKKENLQCVGCACLLLASRLDEVHPPTPIELETMSDKTCRSYEIGMMTFKICSCLKFRICSVTAFHFSQRFIQACCVSHNPVLEKMLSYLLQTSLMCYELVTLKPSLVTASALFLAKVTLGIHDAQGNYWSKTLEYYTTYSVFDLKTAVILLHTLHKDAHASKLTGAYDKFKEEKYLKVALRSTALEEELNKALSIT